MPSPFPFSRSARRKPPVSRLSTAAGRTGILILIGLLAISALGAVGIILHNAHKQPLSLSHSSSWDRTGTGHAKPEPWTANRVRQPIGEPPGDLAPPSAQDKQGSQGAVSHSAADRKAPPESSSPDQASDAPSRPKLPPQSTTIRGLTFERGSHGVESVFIDARGPFRPEVFPLEGRNPFGSPVRLVVDVKDVSSVEDSVSDTEINGSIIRRVRTSYRPASRTFRAVLDLEAGVPFEKTEEMSPDGRRFAVHITGQEKSVPDQELRIRHITFLPGNDSEGERLLIQADRFFEPLVFGLEGTSPYGEHDRIVVDITGVLPLPSDMGPAFEKGRLVREVRHHYHSTERRLRIVLDLAPAEGYEVSQTFFNEQSLYSLSLMGDEKFPETAKRAPAGPPLEESRPADPILPAGPESEVLSSQAGSILRATPGDLTERQIRTTLLTHGFYSTCGIYNAAYCNPGGNYRNRYFDCLEGAVCDEATGLMWEKGGSKRPLTWAEAWDYIADLNRRRAAGYGDWRLPTLEELLSLMESSWRNGGLFIDDRFDATPRTCWSGDTSGAEKAWKANFHLGYVVDSLVEERNWVRAVRTFEPALRGPIPSTKSVSASGMPGGDSVRADRGP